MNERKLASSSNIVDRDYILTSVCRPFCVKTNKTLGSQASGWHSLTVISLSAIVLLMNSLGQALTSCWRFIKLFFSEKLHRSKARVGRSYNLKEIGEYRIFRETVNEDKIRGHHVILIVGFRLKLLHQNKLLHWMLQRVCILTTPFWSGFTGFHIKLWMVQPATGNYLGIYDWVDQANAQIYVDWLVKILRPLSTPDSVWYKIVDADLEKYMEEYEYKIP